MNELTNHTHDGAMEQIMKSKKTLSALPISNRYRLGVIESNRQIIINESPKRPVEEYFVPAPLPSKEPPVLPDTEGLFTYECRTLLNAIKNGALQLCFWRKK